MAVKEGRGRNARPSFDIHQRGSRMSSIAEAIARAAQIKTKDDPENYFRPSVNILEKQASRQFHSIGALDRHGRHNGLDECRRRCPVEHDRRFIAESVSLDNVDQMPR